MSWGHSDHDKYMINENAQRYNEAIRRSSRASSRKKSNPMDTGRGDANDKIEEGDSQSVASKPRANTDDGTMQSVKGEFMSRPTLRRLPTLDKQGNLVSEHNRDAPPWMIYPDSRFYHLQRSLVVGLTLLTAVFLPPFMAFELLTLPYVVALNWVLDVIFLSHVIIVFMTAIPIEGGGYITDPKIIRNKYIRSKAFYIDCLASIPYELIATMSSSDRNLQFLSTLRILRLLRLKNFSITDSQTNLGMLARQIMVLIMLGHFCGCAWWGSAVAQNFPRTIFYTIGDGWVGDWHLETRKSVGDFLRNYIRVLFWGLSSMCSFTANLKPDSGLDCVLCVFIAIIGVVVFAYVVGTIFDVMSTICAKSQSYREYVEEINQWLHYRKLPEELKTRVKEYHKLQFHLLKGVDEHRLLNDLPDTLRREITSTTRSQMLLQNNLFKNLSSGFIGSVCHLMEVQVCLSNEVIVNAGEQAAQMYIISRGMVEVCTAQGSPVATLGVGDIFGEIALLLKRPRTANVWTISVCELFTVSSPNLAEVLNIYEEFNDLMTEYAKSRLFELKKIEAQDEEELTKRISENSERSLDSAVEQGARNIASTDLDATAVKESKDGLFDLITPPDVFLGGACGCTTWRKEIAVPLLEAGGVTYYNPQVDDWHPDLMAAEMYAKKHCKVLLFVINDETRGVASMIEAAALMKKSLSTNAYKMDGQRSMHQDMVLVLQDIDETRVVEGDRLNPKEIKDLNRGRMFLKDLADAGDDIQLFTNIRNAVQFLVEMRREKRLQGSIYS